ncbi:hypothetical protein D779_3971 [Imhoffiella purpurea]|uniref:Uncharacterized protein n=2 Tax=Imhoffiella purpurea TaxID=1249627 RepID=W9V1K3_9GAMM|nr:hypothetical protein D779_3971 [Imhoffiella purpurea]
MAEQGFESNEDYEFQVRCLLESPTRGIRTLNVEGDGERRKTAFATALAHALGIGQVLYHDFTDRKPPLPAVILPPSKDEMGREEPPIDPLDTIVSEACAQSEGDPIVLILDQLQAADFREHIRIHRLASNAYWEVRDGRYEANPHHLLLFLISEDPLYHALQKASFRVWVSRLSEREVIYRPDQFGLEADTQPLFDAFTHLFRALGTTPTFSEFAHILSDLQCHVRTSEHLRLVLYGRAEGMDRLRLASEELVDPLEDLIGIAHQMLVTEHIELS